MELEMFLTTLKTVKIKNNSKNFLHSQLIDQLVLFYVKKYLLGLEN